MGLRTASWIGTEHGVARVRVYSNNPKTPGGFKAKAGTEVTTLQGRSRIGVSAFDGVYDSRFRLIMQGGIEYFFHRDKSLTGRIRLAAHWFFVALRIIRDRLFPHATN